MNYAENLFNEIPDKDYTLIKKSISQGFNDNNATFSSIDSVCDNYIGNDYDYKVDLIKMILIKISRIIISSQAVYFL